MTGGGSGSSASCTSSGSGAATDETAAHQDSSKRYGNAKTAAQIANERGAHAGTKLYGPGNSQPHKVMCGGHWVHVHAVKSYSIDSCGSSHCGCTTTTTTTTPSTSTTGTTTTTPTTSTTSQGGVLGSTGSGGNGNNGSNSGNAPHGGVLGALQTAGHGTLPFTGFPLWAAAVLRQR